MSKTKLTCFHRSRNRESNPTDLKILLQELEQNTLKCIRCFFCFSMENKCLRLWTAVI